MGPCVRTRMFNSTSGLVFPQATSDSNTRRKDILILCRNIRIVIIVPLLTVQKGKEKERLKYGSETGGCVRMWSGARTEGSVTGPGPGFDVATTVVVVDNDSFDSYVPPPASHPSLGRPVVGGTYRLVEPGTFATRVDRRYRCRPKPR